MDIQHPDSGIDVPSKDVPSTLAALVLGWVRVRDGCQVLMCPRFSIGIVWASNVDKPVLIFSTGMGITSVHVHPVRKKLASASQVWIDVPYTYANTGMGAKSGCALMMPNQWHGLATKSGYTRVPIHSTGMVMSPFSFYSK